jgi:hypothetical protein
LYGAVIEHVGIKENPIVTTAYNIVKAFMVSNMPKLRTFNDEPINTLNNRNTATTSQQQDCNHFQHFFQFVKNNESSNRPFMNGLKGSGGAVSNNGNDTTEESSMNNHSGDRNDVRKKRFMQSDTGYVGLKNGSAKATGAAHSSSSSPVHDNGFVSYDDFSSGFDEVVQEMIKNVIYSYHSLHYPIDLEGNENPLLLKGHGGGGSTNPSTVASTSASRRTAPLKKK